jgi:hypothetical protein
MRYADGQAVRLGDVVEMGADRNGVIVCVIETDDYSARYPREKWNYLHKGAMAEFRTYGLVHIVKADADLKLVRRATTP